MKALPELKARADACRPAVNSQSPIAHSRTNPRDFVFLDARSRLYRVREVEGASWLYYWQGGGWVSLRKLMPETARGYALLALPADEAGRYAGGVPFLPE